MLHLLPLVWTAVLLLPNFLWVAVTANVPDALIRGVPPSMAFLVALVAWSRQPGWVLLVLLPFYVLLPLEAYYLLAYGQPSSVHVLAVVAETHFSEALQYIGAGPLLLGAGVAALLLLITVYLARQARPLPRHRLLTWLALASLVPLLQYVWLELDWAMTRPSVFDVAQATSGETIQPMTDVPTPMGVTLSDSYPLGVFFRIRDFLGERERIKQASGRIGTHDFQVRRAQLHDQAETYVLVVGESARPDHWGLNGYGRNTTPRLTLKDRLVSFRNVVTPWPATRLAVPVILVGQQTANHRALPDRASIVSLFKQAGFRTYWLSNQAPLGLHDSIISVHAQEADEVVFTNPTDYSRQGKDDGVLLPVFQRLLKHAAPKKFFVIHTLGSHKRYDQRYPSEFSRFKPADLGNMLADPPEVVVNSYDNSIFFTDHVLAELIAALELNWHSRSALMYLSDHGQTLPLNGCQEDGHGRSNEADFRVAALLWVSESIDRVRPQILQRAAKRRDEPLESVGAFHTLTELADLFFPDWHPERSWISSSWQPRTRWTNAVPDFEYALRESPCGKLKMP